jgi:hypothetical protein
MTLVFKLRTKLSNHVCVCGRYAWGEIIDDKTCEERLWADKGRGEDNFYLMVRRCMLTPPDPYLKGARFQPLRLSSENPVSKSAF